MGHWGREAVRLENSKGLLLKFVLLREEVEVCNVLCRWEVFFQIKAQIQSYERTASLISLLSGIRRRNTSTSGLRLDLECPIWLAWAKLREQKQIYYFKVTKIIIIFIKIHYQ